MNSSGVGDSNTRSAGIYVAAAAVSTGHVCCIDNVAVSADKVSQCKLACLMKVK